MLVIGDTRECGPVFALTAGAQKQNLPAWQIAVIIGSVIFEILRQMPRFNCDIDDAVKGAAGNQQPPLGCLGGSAYGFDAGNVRGKGCNSYAALGLADQLGQRGGDFTFGR